MRFRFDHVVILVPSLAEGIARYSAAGFTVRPGGRHDVLPTENALIPFADGGYLELIALRDAGAREDLRRLAASARWENHLRGVSAIGRRFLPRLAGPEGVCDYALGGTRLAAFAAEARRRGHVMTGPARFGRETPDQRRLEMDLLLPAAEHLPFFIEDHTPREWRVPTESGATAHANGALRVASVTVNVPDVVAAGLELAESFDTAPRVGADGVTHLKVAGVDVRLARGTPGGARGVTLSGVGGLPADIEGDGVRGENAEGSAEAR